MLRIYIKLSLLKTHNSVKVEEHSFISRIVIILSIEASITLLNLLEREPFTMSLNFQVVKKLWLLSPSYFL
jgi:hypothetical protein